MGFQRIIQSLAGQGKAKCCVTYSRTETVQTQAVSGDLSIMSFRGYEFGELMEPQLATVRFENEEAGIIAARTLIQMCRH